MKVYPLIYSRTLKVDYPSGFLVRPKDMNNSAVTGARKYVISAMENVQDVGGVRHAVFSVGDYLVYGGISCVASKLVNRILQSKSVDFPYEEYQADKANRPLIFFIGFAAKKNELIKNELPAVDLYNTYKIYLEYLTKQWHNESVMTEFSNGIELETRQYHMTPAPQTLLADGKRILRNYSEENFQETIDYYFAAMAWGPGGDFSFLSSVLPDDAAKSPFANISPYGCTPEKFAEKMKPSGTSTSYVPPASHSSSEFRTNNVLNRPIAGPSDGSYTDTSENVKKKNQNPPSRSGSSFSPMFVGILAGAAIVIFLLILTFKTKATGSSRANQTSHVASTSVASLQSLGNRRSSAPPHQEKKAAKDPLEKLLASCTTETPDNTQPENSKEEI